MVPAARELLKAFGGHTKEFGHLIDEGARAARAAAVHAHVRNSGKVARVLGMEEDHLGVLATKLNGTTRLGIERADGDGVCHNLLNVGRASVRAMSRAPEPVTATRRRAPGNRSATSRRASAALAA